MMCTGAAKYRMRILYAIRLAKLPKPTMAAMIHGVLGISWSGRDGRLATIVQVPGKPSWFGCQTFSRLKPISVTEINMEALDGPVSLMEFLDMIAGWL
jgi:hypothetical protein